MTVFINNASGSGLSIGSPISGGGANRVLYEDASQNLAASANFTYDGADLYVRTGNVQAAGIGLFGYDGTEGAYITFSSSPFTLSNAVVISSIGTDYEIDLYGGPITFKDKSSGLNLAYFATDGSFIYSDLYIMNSGYGFRNYKDSSGNHVGASYGDLFDLFLNEGGTATIIAGNAGLLVSESGSNGPVLYWNGSSVLDNWNDYANILIGPANLLTCYIGTTVPQTSGATAQVNGNLALIGTLMFYDSTDDNYPYITTADDDFAFYNGLGGQAGVSFSRVTLTPNSDSSALDINGYSGGTSSLVNILSGATTKYTFEPNTLTFGEGVNIRVGTSTGTKIGGASDKIGFFNATPVQRQSSTTDLRTALINLGLYGSGGASPLDLNGGAFTTTGTATVRNLVITDNNTSIVPLVITGSSGLSVNMITATSFGGAALFSISKDGLLAAVTETLTPTASTGTALNIDASSYTGVTSNFGINVKLAEGATPFGFQRSSDSAYLLKFGFPGSGVVDINNVTAGMRLYGSGGITLRTLTQIGAASDIATGDVVLTILGNTGQTAELLKIKHSASGAFPVQVSALGDFSLGNSMTYTESSGVSTRLKIVGTYNQTSTAGRTDILINDTETALGSGAQNFLDFQISGTSKFKILNTGYVNVAAPINLKNYTVATLPAGTRGDIAYVTDAVLPAFLAGLTGGGTVVTPVFYNGTSWVSF